MTMKILLSVILVFINAFEISARQEAYTPDRLVVAEEVQRLAMRSNESFEPSETFAVYNSTLFIPAADQPKIGFWRMGDFRTSYIGAAKTSCTYSHQQSYYLSGGNMLVKTNMEVEECKRFCCEHELCQSFDYSKTADIAQGIAAKTCWFSAMKEDGAVGLTWDTHNRYDYYEVKPTEVISRLAVVEDNGRALLVGSAQHSSNIYQFQVETTAGQVALTPLGVYQAPHFNNSGPKAPVLFMTTAEWGSDHKLLTGGYDNQVLIWAIENNQFVVKQRIEGFDWPIWAIVAGKDAAEGIFVAGGHANITRWVLPLSGNLQAGEETQLLVGHSRLVRCLAYDAGHSIMASGSEDTRIILWHKKSDGNFEFGARLFDHTDSVTFLTFGTPATKSLLMSSGEDGNVMIFDPKADDTTCMFEKQLNYYLPGNNRYVFADSTLDECMKICCESDWCRSFDYAIEADPNGLHGPNTCWMSSHVEGASGLQWDSTGMYHYYEIAKRGTRMLNIKQAGPVSSLVFAESVNVMITEHAGDASNPGGFAFMKLQEVTCPDGQSPNYEGSECVDCRLGFAGTGGICSECPPGMYSQGEGSFECISCPKGWASSITETPSDQLVEDLWGLVKCTECPKWALATKLGQYFCEWCPPGMLPDADRGHCVGPAEGADSVQGKSDWTESWGRDGQERSDAFCPTSFQGNNPSSCLYPSQTVQEAQCPMTCPRNYQVEVDDDWNPKGFRSGNIFSGITTDFDVSWKCAIQNKTAQKLCNKLLCMGAMVSMEGPHEKQNCVKDRTDCTCAETLRESCKGGLQRLREEQCRSQCTRRWCDLMCQRERSREYTGIFRPDNVENPFEVQRFEAKGTECTCTCRNQQRRLSVSRTCGQFDIWDSENYKYLIKNDALCGSEAVYETKTRYGGSYHGGHGNHRGSYEYQVYRGTRMSDQVCLTGNLGKIHKPHSTDDHRQYRPDACVANSGYKFEASFVLLACLVVSIAHCLPHLL